MALAAMMALASPAAAAKPHILFIGALPLSPSSRALLVRASPLALIDVVLPPRAVADDLGFGDLGYTGSAIQTPHIDDLAHNGTVLGHYYVMHCCSPTRSAL